MTHKSMIIIFSIALFAGCGSSYTPFTHDVRSTVSLSACSFHTAIDLEFRSVRLLNPPDTKGIVRDDGRRWLRIAKTDAGRAVDQGEDWITVDFGQGVILKFQRAGAHDTYVMPGWGTITIDGERYDIQMGVLSGTDIRLLWEPATED